ncbi:hypothetical protein [Streptomyces sp. NPDC050988]|uniref:hypothetical protein n=1 Tax=Streptomyces sp. NPDC050988 TaxID=3365637 RepID=UPI00379A6671
MDTDNQADPPGLSAYSASTQETIRSEADVWRHGDVTSALRSFEQTLEWARGLNQEQRKYHKAGYWYTNDNMSYAAVALVQRELKDDPDCDSHLCPAGADCHPRPTT